MKSARKKLKKLCSRKKKKKTPYSSNSESVSHSFSAQRHCSWCCSHAYSSYAHPSAPPLPPDWVWDISPQSANPSTRQESNHLRQVTRKTSLETLIDVAGTGTNIQAADDYTASSSYQQYMIPNPGFGLPLSKNKAKPDGFFSCALKFGTHFLTCVCPCLSISD